MSSAAQAESITAIVITFNEEAHIRRCIERLRPVADRILIVDSFSTDGTISIARELGAEVLQHGFTSHAAQFQWALENGGIGGGWVLRMDADEYFEAAAIDEIKARLPGLAQDVSAVDFRRKVYFQGRWIRWGGHYSTVLTRLWRVGQAHVEQRWMDEHVAVHGGRTLAFSRGDLVDDNRKDITFWTDKHNSYSTRQMIEYIGAEYPLLMSMPRSEEGLNRGARLKRKVRNNVYARLPLYVRAVAYFLQRYLLRLGFLDGRRGFAFHVLQGFWYFLLVDVKVGEARTYIRRHGLDAFRAEVERRHGLVLAPPGEDSRG